MMARRPDRSSAPPPALVRFVDEQYPRVVGAMALYTGDRRAAEDLAQEAFVRLCQHWERVEVMAAPGAWVHRVALNLARSRGRRLGAEHRAMTRVGARPAPAPDGSSADPDHARAAATDIQVALLALPTRERSVVVLRFFADLSVDDTATALGLPAGTVKSTTRRALATLRASGLLTEVTIDE